MMFAGDPGLAARLKQTTEIVGSCATRPTYGRVLSMTGPILRVAHRGVRLGEVCEVDRGAAQAPVLARVIALQEDTAVLSPFSDCAGLKIGAICRQLGKELEQPVGPELLGRVLDGLGQPIDGDDPLPNEMTMTPVRRAAPDPMDRPAD